ncbi:BamA/TamA family outer membrane protein [Ruficoccus amylovorans]|uniref:BamA/TamA family outer membrane protein n=1 Tax=Ruficoccus amylovorans TaxID=1804625 RepID=A0A842HBY2_9BACT|nr:BamA/TamA family outer membrane protein [Ruficoccus amylovorans]MBC2593679.1 BamA/TamA family outer membrane protein [Ruficoccus amylovorans]
MDCLRRLTRTLGLLCLLSLLPASPGRGAELFGLIGNPNVDINGFGFFGDISLTRSLEILEPGEGKQIEFNSIYVEDSLWILSGELKRRGYLYPAIEASLTNAGETVWQGRWEEGDVDPKLPPRKEGDAVAFNIEPGVLFYFSTIQTNGLPDEITRDPQGFFYATDRLYVSEEDRFFSAGRLATGVDSLVLTLRGLGYRDVKAEGKVIAEDRETGAVDVQVEVNPGPLYYVEKLTLDAPAAGDETALEDTLPEDQRLDPSWLQLQAQKLRNRYYASGHPDVVITQEVEVLSDEGDIRRTHVTLKAEPGPVVRIGQISFKNAESVNRDLLEQQANLHEGELLDRSQVEAGRERLSRLGVFRTIRIDYEEAEDGTWNVIYDADMKKQTVVNLIFGVGSFDIVRGGFEVLQNNLWGLAHQSHLSAIQSVRATYVDYTYTIPQILGEDLDFFLSANYLRREEITFDREEYGGSAGLQHFFSDINTAASIQFNYGQVEARNSDITSPPGPTKSLVSSITLKANRNELDNPLFPTDGWQVFGSSEFAFKQLGGQVNFQRIEIGGAWHKPITDSGLVFHAGYKTGVVTSFGSASENIPVPKRFFLGGENTVRGYRRDQASPVNSLDQQIGAVSYMLWQVEFEQRLTEMISVVVFCDTVGNAAEIQDYPFNDVLVSVGAGISLRTVVGPLRFEYGHNVKRRPFDPKGTFQVALGFPF